MHGWVSERDKSDSEFSESDRSENGGMRPSLSDTTAAVSNDMDEDDCSSSDEVVDMALLSVNEKCDPIIIIVTRA